MRVAALLLLCFAGLAEAHRPSDAFLTIAVDGAALRGQWEIALRDVAALAPADADGDRALTWGELRQARPALEEILLAALAVSDDSRPCTLRIADLLVNKRLDGPYAWFALEGGCEPPVGQLTIRYRLLFDLDPTHRGILALTAPGGSHSAVFAPGRDSVTVPMNESSVLRQVFEYLREGVHHIWIGFDHVLFLVALLLPCVLVREQGRWRGAPRLATVSWDTLRVVTAFTVAHSVTLTLSALGVLRLPPVLTESIIALSVIAAALNNVKPVVTRARWGMAFAFGLMHGFGFASVLGELGLPADARVAALLGFNLGVELGQLAIVAAIVPVAFVLRNTLFYRIVFVGGSLAVAALGGFWLLRRSGLLGA